MSFKTALVVSWACLIAVAAVASERHRLNVAEATAEPDRMHAEAQAELAAAEPFPEMQLVEVF